MNDSILISTLAQRLGYDGSRWRRKVLEWCRGHNLTITKIGQVEEVSIKMVEEIILQDRIARFKQAYGNKWEQAYEREYGAIPMTTGATIKAKSDYAQGILEKHG